MNKIGRNDPCPCGSGRKYKQCCLLREGIPASNKPAIISPIPQAIQEAVAHHQAGRLSQAEVIYRQILQAKPDHPEALHLLGVVAHQEGKHEIAVELITRAISVNQTEFAYYNNLGMALEAQGNLDAAAEGYRHALKLEPGYATAHYNLGNILHIQGKLDAAVEQYSNAIACKPDHAAAHNNLASVLQDQGKLDEAIEHCNQALSIKPDCAEIYVNLGNVLKGQGKLGAAAESYRRALTLKSDCVDAYSNLLFLHAYHSLLEPREYLALTRNWEQACVPVRDGQLARGRIFRRPPIAGRRLRVGYVSGDFCRHPVSYFIEQLFARHDRTRVELFAYSASAIRDEVTERLRAMVDHWIPVMEAPDLAVLDRIEADGIDVLIDLSGHTQHNRMGVFARRAAPVQAHYLGYFASTGLTEMDYFIGDGMLTSPETDGHFSEQVWRLPRVRASYEGKADAPLPDWHPVQDGSIWLGSFNNLGKLTPATLALWIRILHALPEGRLLLKTSELADDGNRRRILDAMAGHGVAPDRIELRDSGATPGWNEHMAYYNRLDIALDPVGAHGGYTTTCDALWMGVPVITLEGDRMATRMTSSILDAIGHPEWIARSEAEYVDKVVALARDVELRKALRSGQRGKMAASPLCDAKNLAVSLENAYFEMFERWLEIQHERASGMSAIS